LRGVLWLHRCLLYVPVEALSHLLSRHVATVNRDLVIILRYASCARSC
jgi:hypothetical protein